MKLTTHLRMAPRVRGAVRASVPKKKKKKRRKKEDKNKRRVVTSSR